jgi:type II secretory pathway component GspD/PulD (secretin)
MNIKLKCLVMALTVAAPLAFASAGGKQATEKPAKDPMEIKISVSLKDAPVAALLDAISAQARISFILAEGAVETQVNAQFRDATVREVLKTLSRNYGIGIERVGDSNVYLALKAGKGSMAEASRSPVAAGYRSVILSLPAKRLMFVKTGDRADILSTYESNSRKTGMQKVTVTLLENVIVLGVNRGDAPDSKGTLEIEVNPNEAQYAVLAEHQGELDVITRAPGDTEMHKTVQAAFRKLIVGSDEEAQKDEPEHPAADDNRNAAEEHYEKGLRASRNGDMDKARQEWGMAAKFDPENREVKSALAQLDVQKSSATAEHVSGN